MAVPMSQQTTLHAANTDEEAGHVRRDPAPSDSCHEKKYAGGGTHEDPYVVDWDLGDPENPFNWSKDRKWAITFQVGPHRVFNIAFTTYRR